MKGKQLRQRIDFTLILAVTALVGFSIIMIGSAGGRTFDLLHITLGPSMKRQLLGFALGLVFATVLMLVSRELLNFLTIPIYFFMLLLLLIVLLIGIGSGAEGEEEGVHRWIQLIGGFTLQPSELPNSLSSSYWHVSVTSVPTGSTVSEYFWHLERFWSYHSIWY